MSLSKTIIYGDDKELAKILRTSPALDEIDEYGYTPLTQAVIVNSILKAKLLLEKGAQVDFTDITGRTPLFWAADNNNIELCKLFLKYQANPNAYNSGGQSTLVMPYLKKQEDVKKLLMSAGARLDFAQDFLNAKLIGHCFELEGRIDIVDPTNTFIEVELEGFFLRFTLEIIVNSLIEFENNFGAKKLRKYFAKLNMIIQALSNAVELLRFQHYLVDVKHYVDKINILLDYEPMILPIAFAGHAITLIKLWDWVIRCDRGAYGKEHGTVILYEITEPGRFTKTIQRDLLYKRQSQEYVNIGLVEYLGLKEKMRLSLAPQKSGNCAWANVEAVIPALMFLLLIEELGDQDLQLRGQEAMFFYTAWQDWNKTRAMDFCLQSLAETDMARKAAKASLLMSILFQGCKYHDKEDRKKAEKILTVLSKPELSYPLKAYMQVFAKNPQHPYYKNLLMFIDDFGIDVDKLKL